MELKGVSTEWRGGSGKAIKVSRNPGKILRSLSGRLFGSFNPRSQETLSGSQVTGYVLTSEIGSEVPYAAIHNFGGQAGRNLAVTIPKRPYFTPGIEDLEKELPKIAQQVLDQIILLFNTSK